jgi:dienelactone hydrolase
MRSALSLLIACAVVLGLFSLQSHAQTPVTRKPASTAMPKALELPKDVKARPASFYSEGVVCGGTIFLPPGFSDEGSYPAVVVAPGWTETSHSVDPLAARLAARGIVAMAIDYRGWGASGGYLNTVDQVRTDDRLRFSQMTAKVRVERKRLLPQQQVLDIRNALYYLQGEKGVDRTRVGVWGTDMAGGHVIVVAGVDARVKAVVAQAPMIDGKDKAKRASTPSAALLRAEQRRARYGETASSTGRTDAWAQVMQSEYHPYWSVDQIPAKTAVLFVIGDADAKDVNQTATAASKALKGPTSVVTVPHATKATMLIGAPLEEAAKAAAEWFLKYL